MGELLLVVFDNNSSFPMSSRILHHMVNVALLLKQDFANYNASMEGKYTQYSLLYVRGE